ncbi:MAG TPA: LamG-like jellyroll fold domain-containing protein, partial [Candidatus Sulfotelmatobacter sp.]|nr:LamG-like jellyroll fold domain-containing protein [Candidatus Sulfotelmatobacter sp.]
MTARVMGYCDPWSVAPGETVTFRVSCIDCERYDVQLFRLKQPDAGPLATPFAPEPVDAPCNGTRRGRYQAIPAGSLAVVPPHAALAVDGSVTVAAYAMPTTPAKGRQALVGTWCEATQTGYGLEIDATGALALRLGAGAGRVAVVSTGVPLGRRRWALVAASYDAGHATVTLWQEPLPAHDFDPAPPVSVTASVPAGAGIGAGVAAGTSGGPLTMAAWSSGPVAGPSAWGKLGFTCHFNGRLDSPRLAGGALDRAGVARLLAEPRHDALSGQLIGAWDFSRDIPGETIADLGPWRLDGVTLNLPTRAVRGAAWTGAVMDWTRAPEQYGAIHFHDDDLLDAGWEPDFA